MLTHHAYYIEDSLSMFTAYAQALKSEGAYQDNDPGFTAEYFEKFGIDESRALVERSALKNTSGRSLVFIGIESITSEAQQALLKLLEEPQQGTIFVLLVAHGTLLPTLKSRLLEYPRKLAPVQGTASEAKVFLRSTYKERSDWVAALVKEDDAKEQARSFLNELEQVLHPLAATNREVRESLEQIAHLRQYLADRSPSLKMLLEHLAATVPCIK